MAGNNGYSIAVENTEIVVRIKREAIDQDTLTKFLDYLELESIRRRSQLTDQQAASLADDVDRAMWDKLQSTFTQR